MTFSENKKLLDNKNIAGIILKPDSPSLKVTFFEIKSIFEKFNIQILIEQRSALMIDETNGIPFSELCDKCDFLVSIGGDGTLISATRKAFNYSSKPILGINLGTLGFLTSVLPHELEKFLINFMIDNYKIDQRMMIHASVGFNEAVAFNDIVIKGKSVTHMLTIEATVNDSKFNTYYGDGLVVCTPTGSTAYNISSGGPVVYPLTNALIMTPISAHSLTQRPLVLPAEFEIELSITDKEGALVIIDGQEIYAVKQYEKIKVKQASAKANLIRPKDRDYFKVLNQKLNWGN
jgi:NAD+ kinase